MIFPAGAQALDARSFTLGNGLQVVLVREPKAPVVISQVWYRVGAVDEADGKTGLAHMLEHMMFQGTRTIAPGEFSKIVSRNGGDDNASTSRDYTNYYIKFAADRLELALKLEADRMRHLVLSESEFQAENLVVREERRSRVENKPVARMMEKFRALAFGDHPYGRPVIGLMADLENHTLADLSDWYRRYYAPNNALLVVVGDLEFKQAATWIGKYFGPLPPNPALAPPAVLPVVSPVKGQRIEVREKGATLSRWFAGILTPTLADDRLGRDVFPLDLLVTVLGSGGSSRLYQRLVVDEGLAIGAGASFGGISRYPALFSLSASPKPGVSVSRVEEVVLEEVARMVREPVTSRELERAKNGLIAGHIYARDSIDTIAWTIGRLFVSDIDWRLVLEGYPDRIRLVTAEDVQRVARKYLRPEAMTVGVLLPELDG
ncbi:MAG: insulinase family protein [Magnetococcales bacterium]|nr:insulinase family protein [Magnetococcales bacterium]